MRVSRKAWVAAIAAAALLALAVSRHGDSHAQGITAATGSSDDYAERPVSMTRAPIGSSDNNDDNNDNYDNDSNVDVDNASDDSDSPDVNSAAARDNTAPVAAAAAAAAVVMELERPPHLSTAERSRLDVLRANFDLRPPVVPQPLLDAIHASENVRSSMLRAALPDARLAELVTLVVGVKDGIGAIPAVLPKLMARVPAGMHGIVLMMRAAPAGARRMAEVTIASYPQLEMAECRDTFPAPWDCNWGTVHELVRTPFAVVVMNDVIPVHDMWLHELVYAATVTHPGGSLYAPYILESYEHVQAHGAWSSLVACSPDGNPQTPLTISQYYSTLGKNNPVAAYEKGVQPLQYFIEDHAMLIRSDLPRIFNGAQQFAKDYLNAIMFARYLNLTLWEVLPSVVMYELPGRTLTPDDFPYFGFRRSDRACAGAVLRQYRFWNMRTEYDAIHIRFRQRALRGATFTGVFSSYSPRERVSVLVGFMELLFFSEFRMTIGSNSGEGWVNSRQVFSRLFEGTMTDNALQKARVVIEARTRLVVDDDIGDPDPNYAPAAKVAFRQGLVADLANRGKCRDFSGRRADEPWMATLGAALEHLYPPMCFVWGRVAEKVFETELRKRTMHIGLVWRVPSNEGVHVAALAHRMDGNSARAIGDRESVQKCLQKGWHLHCRGDHVAGAEGLSDSVAIDIGAGVTIESMRGDTLDHDQLMRLCEFPTLA
jgi:hypothetical protein